MRDFLHIQTFLPLPLLLIFYLFIMNHESKSILHLQTLIKEQLSFVNSFIEMKKAFYDHINLRWKTHGLLRALIGTPFDDLVDYVADILLRESLPELS